MSSKSYHIDPRLQADTHELMSWQNCYIRLHKNASLPWLIIIPKTEQIEFHDLPAKLQLEITHISQVVSNYFKTECGAEKINFAAIGNVVQQLHIHVIGRHHKDPLWPDVIWGNIVPEMPYKVTGLNQIKTDLQKLLDLHS